MFSLPIPRQERIPEITDDGLMRWAIPGRSELERENIPEERRPLPRFTKPVYIPLQDGDSAVLYIPNAFGSRTGPLFENIRKFAMKAVQTHITMRHNALKAGDRYDNAFEDIKHPADLEHETVFRVILGNVEEALPFDLDTSGIKAKRSFVKYYDESTPTGVSSWRRVPNQGETPVINAYVTFGGSRLINILSKDTDEHFAFELQDGSLFLELGRDINWLYMVQFYVLNGESITYGLVFTDESDGSLSTLRPDHHQITLPSFHQEQSEATSSSPIEDDIKQSDY
jgi:hypothetical protein